MNMVIILSILLVISFLYSIVISFLYFRKKNQESSVQVQDDIDYKLENIRYRLKKVRRETPSYMKLDIDNR